MSNIELTIEPKSKDLGDNFVVRRSLPDKRKRMVGPFIFWDHMGPVTLVKGKGMKVRAHPHIGLATITWLFAGEIMHRDSLGNEQAIRPGEVNWMTAGNGIVHSERSEVEEGSAELEGIQLWLALPKEHEDVDPSFYHCKIKDVPQVLMDGMKLHLIAGEEFDMKSPVPVYSDLFYMFGEAEKGRDFNLNLKDDFEGAVYVVDGSISVEGKEYEKYNLIIFKKGSEIDFKVTSETKFMVFGGEVFPENRFMWWNFVSSSEQKIEEAKIKWKNNEYPPVINEDEIIPLPES